MGNSNSIHINTPDVWYSTVVPYGSANGYLDGQDQTHWENRIADLRQIRRIGNLECDNMHVHKDLGGDVVEFDFHTTPGSFTFSSSEAERQTYQLYMRVDENPIGYHVLDGHTDTTCSDEGILVNTTTPNAPTFYACSSEHTGRQMAMSSTTELEQCLANGDPLFFSLPEQEGGGPEDLAAAGTGMSIVIDNWAELRGDTSSSGSVTQQTHGRTNTFTQCEVVRFVGHQHNLVEVDVFDEQNS